ncbi:MAG: S9 family peptidase [Bacillota bacterium]
MSQTTRRPMTIEDLYRVKWVSDPQLSPDGSQVAFVLRTVNPKTKQYESHIWMVPSGGGTPYQFTGGTGSDSAPRWSPDGRWLAFVSNRQEKNQIWLIPSHGGEARQLTELKDGAGNPVWSPDSTRLAFTARVGANGQEDEKKDEIKPDVRVITRLHYKMNGTGFLDEKTAQIFVIPVDGGEPKQLTSGPYHHSSPAWAPDGQTIVFAANRQEDADYDPGADLWTVPAEGGELQQLTTVPRAAGSPAYSPDGRYIAFYGHDREYAGATLDRVWVVPSQGGEARVLTADFDRSVGNAVGGDMCPATGTLPIWSPDGRFISFLATDGGRTGLFRVPAEGGQAEPVLGGDRVILGISLNPSSGRAAFAATSPLEIGDLYLADLDTGAEHRLTRVNAELTDELLLSAPVPFTFSGALDEPVEGWVMPPAQREPGRRCPAILEIHGGPHVAYGYAFMHEFQVLAGLGYAVVFSNPHGSQGYGQSFVAATRHDWGGKDYQDVMAAMEYAVAHFDFIDPERLGVTGGSYGGYLTNWIIGQTNRFRAAVTQRSTCNRYSQFGTSDVGYFNGDFEFDGHPWDNPQHYLERSPITYVKQVQTPLLIIHSENDLRCPIEQAEQFYTALKLLRKEVVMVRFAGENHELSRSGKPVNRVERLKQIIGWFEKHLV